jgi:SAM-dependent methyltransferase
MFVVPAAAYDRFMGRYSTQLGPQLADLAGIEAGMRVVDVGCGTGALTGELVKRVGASQVTAVDPSEPFVAAVRERFPEAEVHQASAEALPLAEASFDAALAQLVVHFMSDPLSGLGEMKRVTRPGGVVAACVWDYGGRRGPLSPFWEAARRFDPDVPDESERAGTREGHLRELFETVGLQQIDEVVFSATVEHRSFEDWWAPFSQGVGPVGVYLNSLQPALQAQIEEAARASLQPLPFVLTGYAWAVRGTV